MARMGDELGYIDRDTMKWIPVHTAPDITPRGQIISDLYREWLEHLETDERELVSDEPKDWKLIADARHWSWIVEVNPDWRKGFREHALHHVARLADALEAALERETKLEDDIENLKQQVVRAEENARQWEGNEIAQHERVKELEREVASSEDSQDATHRLRDEGFELWRYR